VFWWALKILYSNGFSTDYQGMGSDAFRSILAVGATVQVAVETNGRGGNSGPPPSGTRAIE